MPEKVPDSITWYDLDQAVVAKFLEDIFGPRDFEIEFMNDVYWFQIPRKLTKPERDKLEAMRKKREDADDVFE